MKMAEEVCILFVCKLMEKKGLTDLGVEDRTGSTKKLIFSGKFSLARITKCKGIYHSIIYKMVFFWHDAMVCVCTDTQLKGNCHKCFLALVVF